LNIGNQLLIFQTQRFFLIFFGLIINKHVWKKKVNQHEYTRITFLSPQDVLDENETKNMNRWTIKFQLNEKMLFTKTNNFLNVFEAIHPAVSFFLIFDLLNLDFHWNLVHLQDFKWTFRDESMAQSPEHGQRSFIFKFAFPIILESEFLWP
jgi:hypothetical protein